MRVNKMVQAKFSIEIRLQTEERQENNSILSFSWPITEHY